MTVEVNLEELAALCRKVQDNKMEVLAFPNGAVTAVTFEVEPSIRTPGFPEVKHTEEHYCHDVIALFNVIVSMQERGIAKALLRIVNLKTTC